MNLKAKMQCREVTKNLYGQELVKLAAVCADEVPENQRFAMATPSGALELTIDNPGAQGVITPGKMFYVDLTPAN
jgi:hypothetical protein